MDPFHTAFGLKIRSNIPIPELALLNDSGAAADLVVQLGISPYSKGRIPSGLEELSYESSFTDDSGNPALRIWKSADGLYLRLAYSDGTQFWLERRGKEIWATWPEISTLENANLYLLGPVLGLALRLRGITCLHASAVALGDHSVAFVGAEGAGKSTTAAAFAREGYSVVSDDVVALRENETDFLVMPAYPRLCLWPDSVAMLYGTKDTRSHPNKPGEKHRLALGDRETRFECRSLPLGAIYLLADRREDMAPSVETLPLKAGLLTLVADTFANKTLDREMRAREFEVLGRLVATVPVRRVIPHNDPSRIADLCRVIREDFASLRDSMRNRPWLLR